MRYKIEYHTANGWAIAAEFKDGPTMNYEKALKEALNLKRAWPKRIIRLVTTL